MGERTEISLTLRGIMQDIAVPTKSGAIPTEADCLRFRNLCKARELNPWSGDCFMLGFDSNNGPRFELIVSYQAMLKRAEANDSFAGMRGGVVIQKSDGTLDFRDGALLFQTDIMVGAWAEVYRTDRKVAHRAVISRGPYDTGMSRWKVDPAGMLCKVAKSAALREAFPSSVGGMYTEEEMLSVEQAEEPLRTLHHTPAATDDEPADVDAEAAASEDPAEDAETDRMEAFKDTWRPEFAGAKGDIARAAHGLMRACEERDENAKAAIESDLTQIEGLDTRWRQKFERFSKAIQQEWEETA